MILFLQDWYVFVFDDQNRKSMARLILILLYCTLGFNVQSQLTLAAPNKVQDPGDEFFIDITAGSGFDSIGAIQFAMKWDSSVIEFLDLDSFNLPTSTPNIHFSFAYLSNGLLPCVWLHPNTGNIDLPNGALIMRLKFKAIGSASSSTPFNFVNTNSANISALAGIDFSDVEVILDNGEIKLTPLVSIQSISELENLKISPNPSSQDISVHFSLSQSVNLTWQVSDMNGKEILTRQFAKADGQQTILIDRDIFPATGVYLFSLQSTKGVLTRKLIVQ